MVEILIPSENAIIKEKNHVKDDNKAIIRHK